MKKRLTLEEVARDAHVHRMSLYRLTDPRGHHPSARTLERLCAYFGCELSDLVELSPSPPVRTPVVDSSARDGGIPMAALHLGVVDLMPLLTPGRELIALPIEVAVNRSGSRGAPTVRVTALVGGEQRPLKRVRLPLWTKDNVCDLQLKPTANGLLLRFSRDREPAAGVSLQCGPSQAWRYTDARGVLLVDRADAVGAGYEFATQFGACRLAVRVTLRETG